MPQLMPFFWINSVFMSLVLLMTLTIMYNYIKSFILFMTSEVKFSNYNIEW